MSVTLCCLSNNQVRPDEGDGHCDALLLGPEGAGKTLLTRRLQGLHDTARQAGFHASTFPTAGVEITHVKCKGASFKHVRIRELGGCMGPIWPSYFADCASLVFVVDGRMPSTWPDAGQKLQAAMQDPAMQGKPCLVVVNKCDQAAAPTTDQGHLVGAAGALTPAAAGPDTAAGVGGHTAGAAGAAAGAEGAAAAAGAAAAVQEGAGLPLLVQVEEGLGWKQLQQAAQGPLNLQLASALDGQGAPALLAWLMAVKKSRLSTGAHQRCGLVVPVQPPASKLP